MKQSSMTLLFNYLALLQNDKGEATCLIRESLPVTEREGKREGKKSIGPRTKYGHAKLNSFCPCTNGRCSIFNLPLLYKFLHIKLLKSEVILRLILLIMRLYLATTASVDSNWPSHCYISHMVCLPNPTKWLYLEG